jgi:uncharacterized protein (DUF302 family)
MTKLAHRRMLLLAALAVGAAPAAMAAAGGLVTVESAYSPRETLDRFAAAVRATNWTVFGEIDHAAAARDAEMQLPPRTVLLFGNPRAGTPGMAATPTLALDLPMRILVWGDETGRTFLTRSTGEDIATRIFARHGVAVPPAQQEAAEALLERLVRQATE